VPTRITVREYLLKEWLPTIKGTSRPTTYAIYEMHVEGHIVPALGSLQLDRVSAQAINAFYAKILAGGRLQGKGSLSPATVRRVHATLHRALKDAVRWQRLSVNPVDVADPPRGQSTQRQLPAWNAGQLASFLSHVKDDRLFAFWRLLAMTGCRRGEALGLSWDDLDVEAATLTIRRALVPLGAEVIVSEPKTARGRRRIALDPTTIEALKAHAARQADEQSACDTWNETGYIFTTWMVSLSIPTASARPSSATCVLPFCLASRSTACAIPTPPWPSAVGSIRASSRGGSGTRRWPSPWTSTRTSCPKPIRTPPTGSRP
jgi:integrase